MRMYTPGSPDVAARRSGTPGEAPLGHSSARTGSSTWSLSDGRSTRKRDRSRAFPHPCGSDVEHLATLAELVGPVRGRPGRAGRAEALVCPADTTLQKRGSISLPWWSGERSVSSHSPFQPRVQAGGNVGSRTSFSPHHSRHAKAWCRGSATIAPLWVMG